MEEGEPILGGPQAASGSTAASNVGPQPINPAAPAAPSTDFSSFQSNAQPNASLSSSPTQPISPARPQSVPRLTNRFSDRAALNQPSQAPLINSTPQNMQFVQPNPQIDSYASEIMSSPAPQPKKSKKWIAVVLILLALTGIGVAAVMFVPTLLTGPVQELTKEQYDKIYDSSANLIQMGDFIEDGSNGEISTYDLLLKKYLSDNNKTLAEAIASSAIIWNAKQYDISYLLESVPNDLSGMREAINDLSNNNYSSNIKKKAKEIQNDFDQYSEIINSLIVDISDIEDAFSESDDEKIEKIIETKDMNKDIIDFLSVYDEKFQSVLAYWEECTADKDAADCKNNLNINNIQALVDDTRISQEIINSIVDDSSLELIKRVNTNISELNTMMGDHFSEK